MGSDTTGPDIASVGLAAWPQRAAVRVALPGGAGSHRGGN